MTRRSRPVGGGSLIEPVSGSGQQSTHLQRRRSGPRSYWCSEGHTIETPVELDACLAFVLGRPCAGYLRSGRRGSRGAGGG